MYDMYKGGPPKTLELSPGEWSPCSAGFPHGVGECSRDPSLSVYQMGLLGEAVFSFCEFFLKSLSTRLPISWWVIYKLPRPHHAVLSRFWPKTAWPPCPTLPIHPFSPWATFLFVSPDEKSPQRETFCTCGRGETKKTAEVLKGVKINKFKNCFEQWKKISW